ncbi:cytochrome P450 [Streptomyces yaizuensis]|uniref:Cytochrome P450 n=1 Tax=Streptomyces yaizuensis TaxID=2989713 RepID=A0ABQ5NXY8_9ACTN|nr:cytochrome P450 [Streptomyces sp. YSPA8]GLF95109.1 cytochrome P450 [Streptomyces sp. YSPA8]
MTAQTRSVPDAPGALPLVGHIPPMMREPLRFLGSLPDCGDVVRIRLGRVPTLVLCDPELTWQMFMDSRTFDKGGSLVERAREFLGNGLITCPHGDHRRQRRLTQPAFHSVRLRGYVPFMNEVIAETVRSWPQDRPVDPVDTLMSLSARVTARCMFSHGIAEERLRQFIADSVTAVDTVYLRSVLPPVVNRLPLPANLRYQRALQRLQQMYTKIIAEYRADGRDRGDLLSILLDSQDGQDGQDGQGGQGADGSLSDGELRDQLSNFFLAGTETTASTLGWALHALAEHPEFQERLRTEADTVLGGRPADFDDLERLHETRRILTEVLRLYSPVWFVTRTVTADTRLGPYFLPAGTAIAYSPYIIHHLPGLYPDPGVFDPDRWASGHTRPRHAFIPFALGPRKCIGDVFALTQATLALTAIAARFTWEPAPGSRVTASVGSVTRARGLRLRFTARPPGARRDAHARARPGEAG